MNEFSEVAPVIVEMSLKITFLLKFTIPLNVTVGFCILDTWSSGFASEDN